MPSPRRNLPLTNYWRVREGEDKVKISFLFVLKRWVSYILLHFLEHPPSGVLIMDGYWWGTRGIAGSRRIVSSEFNDESYYLSGIDGDLDERCSTEKGEQMFVVKPSQLDWFSNSLWPDVAVMESISRIPIIIRQSTLLSDQKKEK